MTRIRIVVLTTGGTIASSPDDSGRNRSGAMKGEDLMSHVALPADAAIDVEVRSLLQKPSNAISLYDLLTLRRECQRLAHRGDVAGIVITHGTDTLEETDHASEFIPGKRGRRRPILGRYRGPGKDRRPLSSRHSPPGAG